jgi:hypothetical protein
LLLLFTALTLPAWPADRGGPVEYIGGTIEKLEPGDDGLIYTTNAFSLLITTRKASIGIPYKQINLLEYGQKVDRRILMAVAISPLFLLSKARKHFLTVGFAGDDGQQHAMVFRVDKNKVRAVLASLEARTGLRIQYQDEEARKAGRG